jgi:hypothetical protein
LKKSRNVSGLFPSVAVLFWLLTKLFGDDNIAKDKSEKKAKLYKGKIRKSFSKKTKMKMMLVYLIVLLLLEYGGPAWSQEWKSYLQTIKTTYIKAYALVRNVLKENVAEDEIKHNLRLLYESTQILPEEIYRCQEALNLGLVKEDQQATNKIERLTLKIIAEERGLTVLGAARELQRERLSIKGYRLAKWGMSHQRVRDVFPKEEFSDLGHPVIDFWSGAVDELVDFFYFEDRILDQKVTINFYFFKNQLFQVKVYRRAGEFSFYEILSDLLKEKYGKPVQEEVEPDKESARTLWLGDGLNVIELSFNPKSLLFPGITISYIDTALEKELGQARKQREKLQREETQKKL